MVGTRNQSKKPRSKKSSEQKPPKKTANKKTPAKAASKAEPIAKKPRPGTGFRSRPKKRDDSSDDSSSRSVTDSAVASTSAQPEKKSRGRSSHRRRSPARRDRNHRHHHHRRHSPSPRRSRHRDRKHRRHRRRSPSSSSSSSSSSYSSSSSSSPCRVQHASPKRRGRPPLQFKPAKRTTRTQSVSNVSNNVLPTESPIQPAKRGRAKSVFCDCVHHTVQSPPTAPWVPKTVRFNDTFNNFASARNKPVPPLMPLSVVPSREFQLRASAQKFAASAPLVGKPTNVNAKVNADALAGAKADADALAVQLSFNRHMQTEIGKLRKFIDQANKERDFYKMKLKSIGIENIDPNVGETSQVKEVTADVHMNADGENIDPNVGETSQVIKVTADVHMNADGDAEADADASVNASDSKDDHNIEDAE